MTESQPRYGMVVDLNRCVGCQTCTIACKHANDTPPGMQWRRVLDVERGTYPDVERLFLVTGCQHCAEPPCVPVCPTGATRQRADGLVTMDYDTCIGCGFCAVACPYQARTIAHDTDWYYGEPTAQEAHVAHDERVGVANKCTFCVERVDEAVALGLTPGVDLEYTPACAASCIAQALHFGDFADPESNVSLLASENASFQMHAELGTDPQIRYLYDVPNTTPGRAAEAADTADAAMSDPENPLVGERQTFWDARAAMNFTLGGLSGGMMAVAGLAAVFGMVGAAALVEAYVVAAALMALGLFFVFLEIGRKLRFLYVLLRPQSSWMTRETYAVGVLYPALAADFLWPHPVLHALVALAGAAFLYCQARILFAGKGVPAWRAPLLPWLIAVSGLLEGAGLLAFLMKAMGTGAVSGVAWAIVALSVAAGILWHRYRKTAAAAGIGPLARAELDAVAPVVAIFGHAAPALLCLLGLAIAGPMSAWAIGLGGILAIAGGALWKFTVIVRACHQQGFAIPMMPTRGSGTRAAPGRLESI